MLEFVQIVFFAVSTIGVIIATVNHFWFVRDRNLTNILQIKEMLQDAYIKYETDKSQGNELQVSLMKIMNAILMYCTIHNNNQIKKSTKVIHQHFVSSVIEEIFSEPQTVQKLVANSCNHDVIRKFVDKNPDLFSDQQPLLKIIDATNVD